MALNSAGVEVTFSDESQYVSSSANSVPLVVVATAQDKLNASGTGIAAGTLAVNANRLYQVTSQRDLTTIYGNPTFYKTSTGTSIHGHELNEYGLLATYSALGITNRAYVLRADIDLASLEGSASRPTGTVDVGTVWLDATNTKWGIRVVNSKGKLTTVDPIVITSDSDISNGVPLTSIGNIGDYAVVSQQVDGVPSSVSTYFYKLRNNTWTAIGSESFGNDMFFAISNNAPTELVDDGDPPNPIITFTTSAGYTFSVLVPPSPNDNIAGLVTAINDAGNEDITATIGTDGKLRLYSTIPPTVANPIPYVIIGGSEAILASLSLRVNTAGDYGVTSGIATGSTKFFTPYVGYGRNAEGDRWSTGQSGRHPAGSVWIGTDAGASDNLSVVASKMSATGNFVAANVYTAQSDYDATGLVDAAGGKNIPAGTMYAQVNFNGQVRTSNITLHERYATGAAVYVASKVPTVTNGAVLKVRVSLPNSKVLSSEYTVTISGSTAPAFVTSWTAQNIPNTKAEVRSGVIVLTHTAGGEIVLRDNVNGTSTNVIADIGFAEAQLSKTGPLIEFVATAAPQSTTTGSGTGATFNVTARGNEYLINGIAWAGNGHVVGDQIKILGGALYGTSPSNDLVVRVEEVDAGEIVAVSTISGQAQPAYTTLLSNWVQVEYISDTDTPVAVPLNNTNWYFSAADQVDIMVNVDGVWTGYGNVGYAASGLYSQDVGGGNTDPNGPIVAAIAPTKQSDGTALTYGDLWIDSSDLENYPMIYRWAQDDNLLDTWIAIDTTDQISQNGIVFADARWGTDGDIDQSNDPIPAITDLLISDYVDLDVIDGDLYPSGMLLFNTRRSGYNVKQYRKNYFNLTDFAGQVLPTFTDSWVSISGNRSNGSMYAGRKAQRNVIVQAIKASVAANEQIREDDTYFNLIAAPGYPELQSSLITLNNDRNQTAYIIGDTPMRLSNQATELSNWANNTKLTSSTGDDGLVSRSEFMGLYYPAGITTDLSGADAVVPASHMMLRTFLRNDQVAYPWFAAAGERRGLIDNADNIGYIDAATGEFVVVKNSQPVRGVLESVQINPLTYFTGVGLLNYGNLTSKATSSALDRTNVSRLSVYLRYKLQTGLRNFVFEQNDSITRRELAGRIESLMLDIAAKRGLYAFAVVCDESNNTPARIDRNEIWADVAIEATRSGERIYIPVRHLNVGELSGK